jgi:hypothetical protein
LIQERGEAKTEDERRIARIFTHNAKVAVAAHLKAVYRNVDPDLCALAASMSERGSFPWDVV